MSRLSRGLGVRRLGAAVALVPLVALAAGQPVAAQEPGVHVINYGDTLSQIAVSYGLSLDQLVAMNGIDDPDLIIAGEALQLPSNREEMAVEAWDDASVDAEVADEEYVETVATEEIPADWVPPPCCPDYVDPWMIQQLLIETAERYGWDPTLIMAQAWQESLWRQDEVSWVGAVGVMQVMPATADGMNSWYFAEPRDIWSSVADNIETGVAYLTMMYETTGSVELALASYYQGWYSVQVDGFFPDTHEYVDRIFAFQAMFQNGELP